MNENERTVRGPQIPHGTMLASLVASEMPCGKEGCDSWKTVGLDVAMIAEERESFERYSICLPHLPDFIDTIFYQGEGVLGMPEDCGDPECEFHHPDEEEDEDFYDEDWPEE